MRISTPLTSRARKDNTVSQCVTRTRRECRGLIISAIRESVPMAYTLCTGYIRRNSRRNFPQRLVSRVIGTTLWQMLRNGLVRIDVEKSSSHHLPQTQSDPFVQAEFSS